MKNLANLNSQELQKFFSSFDYVLSDVDGVLWNFLDTIPGTQETIKSLKKIGKKVIIVSNNTSKSINFYHHELTRAGFDVAKDEIVTPTLAIITYLKKQDLKDKEVFVLGMTPLKRSLEKAGFKLAQNEPDRIKESNSAFAAHTIPDDGKVGAVVADVDINLNYVNLQKAATYLERPEVLFVKGAADCHLPVGWNKSLIGPGYFTKILEDKTKREGVPMAKPSRFLHEYIVEKYQIGDPSRVLFVGDSIPSDMGFAAESKYQKLLVFSGATGKNVLKEWDFPHEYKPDYYADSLKSLNDCILRTFACKL